MSYGVKTTNSFFALLDSSPGGDADVSNKKKNKKKKNKASSPADPRDSPEEQRAAVPQVAAAAVAKPAVTTQTTTTKATTTSGTTPVSPDAKHFVSADKRKTSNNITSADALGKALEAAASFGGKGQAVQVFADWLHKVNASDHSGSQVYSKGGKTYTFKQVLLESSALEIAAQKCLEYPLDETEEQCFQELFSVILAGPAGDGIYGRTFAMKTAQLARALVDEEPEIIDASKYAVFAAAGALKQGAPAADELAPKLQALDKQVNDTISKLKTLEASANQAASLNERIRCSAELLRVTESKFDLTSSGTSRTSANGLTPNPAEVMQYLESLLSLSQTRLTEAQSCNISKKEMKQEKAKALQAQQESLLHSEVAQVTQQIRVKEAELESLKAKARQLQVKLQGFKGTAPKTGSAGDEAAKAVRSIQRYEEQLRSTRALETLIQQHQKSITMWTTQHSGSTQARASAAHSEYLSAVERQLKYKSQQQLDLKQRAKRVAKMAPPHLPEDEVKKMGMQKEQEQIKQKMKNMMKDIVNLSEEAMTSLNVLRASLQTRTPALRAIPAAAQQLQYVQTLLAELQSGHADITEQIFAPKEDAIAVKPKPAAAEITLVESVVETEKGASDDMAKQMALLQAQMASMQAGLKEKDAEIQRLQVPHSGASTAVPSEETDPAASKSLPQRNNVRSAKRGGGRAAPGSTLEVAAEATVSVPEAESAPSASPKAAMAARAAASAALGAAALVEPQPAAESSGAPVPVVPAEPPKPKKTWGVIEKPPSTPVAGTADMPTLAEAMAAETKGKGRRGKGH